MPRRAWMLLLALAAPAAAADPERGTVAFKPAGDARDQPERYRLAETTFDYVLTFKSELKVSGIRIDELTFPSPVKSPHAENNTVYAEYYRPTEGQGPFPACIVLDILVGDGKVARLMSKNLAQNGVAALFVQMAYYGPRRPKEGHVRFLSTDIDRTLDAVRQSVLDCRCAATWLGRRPEVDAERLGVVGTSLGSFVAALTAASEPRLNRVALVLGGGGLVDAFWDHPRAEPYLKMLEDAKVTKADLKKKVAPADPLTYAESLKKRDVLMIAAKRDDVVPPACAEALWAAAAGKPKIVWLDATHVGAALHLFEIQKAVVAHLGR